MSAQPREEPQHRMNSWEYLLPLVTNAPIIRGMDNTKQFIAALAGVALTVLWVCFISGIAVWITDPSALPGNMWTAGLGLLVTVAIMFGLWTVLEKWADPFH